MEFRTAGAALFNVMESGGCVLVDLEGKLPFVGRITHVSLPESSEGDREGVVVRELELVECEELNHSGEKWDPLPDQRLTLHVLHYKNDTKGQDPVLVCREGMVLLSSLSKEDLKERRLRVPLA